MNAFDYAAEDAPLAACEGPGAVAARRAGQDFDRLVALWQSLRGALIEIDHTVKAACGEPQLGLAHWLVLLHLGRSVDLMQSELRHSTGLDSGFLTRLLDELVARELVQRFRDNVDRRQVRLKISPRGSAATRAMLGQAGDGLQRLLARLPAPAWAP